MIQYKSEIADSTVMIGNTCHQHSDIRALVSNNIVDNSDVIGASPASATSATSSFST